MFTWYVSVVDGAQRWRSEKRQANQLWPLALRLVVECFHLSLAQQRTRGGMGTHHLQVAATRGGSNHVGLGPHIVIHHPLHPRNHDVCALRVHLRTHGCMSTRRLYNAGSSPGTLNNALPPHMPRHRCLKRTRLGRYEPAYVHPRNAEHVYVNDAPPSLLRVACDRSSISVKKHSGHIPVTGTLCIQLLVHVTLLADTNLWRNPSPMDRR
jgi:hypothetical protein